MFRNIKMPRPLWPESKQIRVSEIERMKPDQPSNRINPETVIPFDNDDFQDF